jgi:predicted nucleic acid-binding protein
VILVDSSVWIDYFRGIANPTADRLQALLGGQELLVADLVLVEVLQGYSRDSDFATALDLMSRMEAVTVGGADVAVSAARNFRFLRGLGVTVRKTIDCLIATRCIMDGHALLYSDRDFEPFVEHLGLVSAMSG